MLILMELPDHKDAIAFRQTLREDYWKFEVGEALPEAVIDPKNGEELTKFMSYAQGRKKELQRLNASSSL